MTPLRFLAVLAGLLIGLSVVMLERGRAGLEISDITVGTTPATLYQRRGGEDDQYQPQQSGNGACGIGLYHCRQRRDFRC